ncbi:hypothetical protein BRC91_07210 [Halobacteriales archaeon QS_4_62_28]|nr:MAG: hypothetical protein BRC91_07210 [Halobacteriales archaeon QS_4_62_28]
MTKQSIGYRHYLVGSWTYLVAAVLLVGFAGMVLAYYIPNPYTKSYPPLLIGAGVVSMLLFKRRNQLETTVPEALSVVVSFRNVVVILYLLLIMIGTVLSVMSGAYLRPLSVHVILVLLSVLTVALIFALDSSSLALGAVILTGLFHRTLAYYASAIQIGRDTLFHNRVASDIATTGTLEPLALSKYWYAPIYHLFTAATKAGLDIPIRDAAFLTTTIPMTVVPTVAIFILVGRVWNSKTAVLGSFLYVTADHVISTAILPGPTSFGLALFLVMLVGVDPYLDTDHRYPWLFVAGLLTLFFTHQISLFIAFVGIGAYISGRMLWNGTAGLREGLLLVLLSGGVLLQSTITRYNGPQGGDQSFFAVTLANLLDQLQFSGRRTAASLPESTGVVVSGSDASSFLQVLGSGILLSLAVVGAIYWISGRQDRRQGSAVGFSAMTTFLCLFVFIPPVFGINFFLPSRWFPFLYVPLVVLGAPGLVVLVSLFTRQREFSGQSVTVQFIIALLVITAPYVALMTLNGQGAVDGPVLEEAPSASRQSTTAAEQATYEFVINRAGGTAVITDFQAKQTLERRYEQPTVIYRTRHRASGSVYESGRLYIYREYAETDHASYEIRYQSRNIRVFGSLPPVESPRSVIYTNGGDRIIYG